LSVKQEQYVEASQSYGAGWLRIAFRDVLPNCMTPILVKATLDMGWAILLGASLGFLGLGAQPPTAEWGVMIATGYPYIPEYWWLTVFPGLAIFGVVLGFNFLGDGLRDVFDVQLEMR
jgi:peptide/nickel transport system permease protein